VAELVFVIKPDGSVKLEAVDFSGTSCLEASRPYEKTLGSIVSRKKKPEIYSEGMVKTGAGSRNRAKN